MGSISRNPSIRIQIFSKKVFGKWLSYDREIFHMPNGNGVPSSHWLSVSNCCLFFCKYLFLIWSNWLLPMYLYLLLWDMCKEECVVGRFGLFIKKSIICVLAISWMWQHAEYGLQTCKVGEDESRIHLLVTLLCHQPKWVAQICNNQVEVGFSEFTASCILTAKAGLLWLITSDTVPLLMPASFLI